MILQSLTEMQIYAIIGVLVMATMVFGLPLLLIFLDRRGFNTHLGKPKNLNRHQRRRKKDAAKTRIHKKR